MHSQKNLLQEKKYFPTQNTISTVKNLIFTHPILQINCLQVSSVLLRRETRILNLETSVVIVTGRFNKWSVLVLLVGQPTRNVVQNLNRDVNGLGPSADKRHVQVLQSHRRQTDQTITSDNSPLNRRKTDTFYRTLLLATWTKTERERSDLSGCKALHNDP